MSSPPPLNEGFHKLNEIGQLVLLVNSMKDLPEQQREALKELATKKDPNMLSTLHSFISDQDYSKLQSSWKELVPEGSSSFIHKKKHNSIVHIAPKDKPKPRIEQITNNLLNLRKSVGLEKKNPNDLVVQLKTSFYSKENLNFEDFSKIVLQIEPTSEPLANLNKLRAVKALFDLLDQNKSNSLSREEVRNSLILLCGGSIEEKVNAFFAIHDDGGDGLVSYEVIVGHLKDSILISMVMEPTLRKPNLNVEALALATAENLFGNIDCSFFRLVSRDEYLAWLLREPLSEQAKEEKQLKVKARLEKRKLVIGDLKKVHSQLYSKENLKEIAVIKKSTGLGKVPVANALKLFKSRNTAGYFSRQQFTELIKELVQKYDPSFPINSDFYSSVTKLFIRFDQDGNGVMDTSELFSGLSLICAGTLGEKVYSACNCFDESQDGLMQYSEVRQFFKVVFQMILPEEALLLITSSQLAEETANNLFSSCKLEKSGAASAEMLKKWLISSKFKVF
jgi:Ca2+-binding EF-hand superfamily protein